MNGFTAFSVKPLRIGIALGFGSSVIGFLVAIITLIRKLVYTHYPGWIYLTNSNTIDFGRTDFRVLGIIGEYVGRIYMCINRKPQYVIESIIGREKEYEEFD